MATPSFDPGLLTSISQFQLLYCFSDLSVCEKSIVNTILTITALTFVLIIICCLKENIHNKMFACVLSSPLSVPSDSNVNIHVALGK